MFGTVVFGTKGLSPFRRVNLYGLTGCRCRGYQASLGLSTGRVKESFLCPYRNSALLYK